MIPHYTIISHRGNGAGTDPKKERENTISSCVLAFAQGADEVEVDISETKDGELILYHNPTIQVGFLKSKKVREMAFAEIARRLPDITRVRDIMILPNRNFVF